MDNPIQPIIDGRFKPNKVVEYLLDNGGLNMNDLARQDFTDDDRAQFAQLIGYSVGGLAAMSYISDELYSSFEKISETGKSELEVRNETLRSQLTEIRRGLKIAAAEAFRIHEDDLHE